MGAALPPNVNNGASTFFDYVNSPLYRPLADDAAPYAGRTTTPAIVNSAGLVGRFISELNRQFAIVGGAAPGFSATARSPLFRAANGTALRTDILVNGTAFSDGLRTDLALGVPLPSYVTPSGSDGGLTPGDNGMGVWSPQMDTYWEFFQMMQRLNQPGPFATATVSGSGTVPAGLQVYKVTAYNANGETYGRSSGYQVTVNGSQGVLVDWSTFLTPGNRVAGWRIYRGTTTAPAQNYFLAQTGPNTKTYLDTGAVALDTARKIPTTNTATTPGLWQCTTGGVVREVSTSPGWFRNRAHAGFPDENVLGGESATEIFTAACRIQKGDLVKGVINHIVDVGLPNLPGIVHPSVWAYPCQNTDGRSTFSDKIPYGTRFRFPTSINFDTYDFQTGWNGNGIPPGPAQTRLIRFARIYAKAIQSYGVMAREGSTNTVFYMESPQPYTAGIYTAGTPQNPIDSYIYDDGSSANYIQQYGPANIPEQRTVIMSLPWNQATAHLGGLCDVKGNPCPRGGTI